MPKKQYFYSANEKKTGVECIKPQGQAYNLYCGVHSFVTKRHSILTTMYKKREENLWEITKQWKNMVYSFGKNFRKSLSHIDRGA